MAYVISLLMKDYFLHSVFSSLYFIGVDFLLNYLVVFTFSYINEKDEHHRIFLRCIQILAALDTAVYLINPFKEIAISYVRHDMPFFHYDYSMMTLYTLHLVYTYFLVAVVLFMLIYKAVHVPYEYRLQYILCADLITVIVGLNAVFLFLPLNSIIGSLDISIILYSVTALAFYLFCFVITRQGYFHYYQGTIFRSINQGIVVFDYDDSMIMINERAKALVGDIISVAPDLTLSKFADAFSLDRSDFYEKENYSLQVYPEGKAAALPLRLDYKKLYSESRKREAIGRMFVISDVAQETDILTGYHRWANFKSFLMSEPDYFPVPCVISVCDINALSVINNIHGRGYGDKVIKDMADSIRAIFGKEAYYVRGNEANLIALSRTISVEEAKAKMEELKNESEQSIQYAVSVTDYKNTDLIEVIETTISAMKSRKILDKDSAHSAILTSLINALQQSDPDTESHVKRTQMIGRKFASRLNLSVNDITKLELLCILHDIGKLGIPLEILNKPGKLNDEEWALMETHVEKGYQIALSSSDFSPVADLILHHHERWDGKGYPSGLSKESIPLLSRIISVIDAYDAMISERPYKKPMTHEAARAELAKNAGTQFDPRIVSEFLLMLREEEKEIHDGISDLNQSSDVKTKSTPEIMSPLEGTIDASSPLRQVHTGAIVFPITYTTYVLDGNDYRIIKIDNNFTSLTGYTKEDIQEKTIYQQTLIPSEDITNYMLAVQEQLAKNHMAYLEHRLLCKNGDIKYVFCLGRQYYDSATKMPRTEIIVCDSSNTKAVKLHVENAREKAFKQREVWEETFRHDSMTNLLSHGAFVNDVDSMLLNGDRVGLMILDVDSFKKFNDTYGHQAGDELLIILATALKDAVGEDGLTCRLGGDEFAAAIPYPADCDIDKLRYRLTEIFDKINGAVKHTNADFSISMGIAFSSEDTAVFSKLYNCADSALYTSKNAGRSRCTFFNEPF